MQWHCAQDIDEDNSPCGCWHCAQAPDIDCVDLTSSPVASVHGMDLSQKDYDLIKGDDGSPECTTNREMAMKYMRDGGTDSVLFAELLNKPDTPNAAAAPPTPYTGTTRSFGSYSVRAPPPLPRPARRCPPRAHAPPRSTLSRPATLDTAGLGPPQLPWLRHAPRFAVGKPWAG
jgi:hypothetical protein